MSSIIRKSLCAAAFVALLPAVSAAQSEVRVMAHGGLMPFTTIYGGGQVEVGPRGGNAAFYADYNQWAFGMGCEDAVDPVWSSSARCGETGYSLHGGVTGHLGSAGARWRPYASGGAGVARVLDHGLQDRPLRLSLAAEGGYDFGGARPLNLRLGLRWQGRPQVGTDYAGPVVGVRLRF